MKRDPLLEYDDRFVYSDDLTRLTRREIVKLIVGTVVVVAAMWAFVVLLSLS